MYQIFHTLEEVLWSPFLYLVKNLIGEVSHDH